MLGRGTIFSVLFRLIERLRDGLAAVESFYETSLFPKRIPKGFFLQRDYRSFLCGIREKFFNFLFGREQTRIVVRRSSRDVRRPNVVHFIVRVGVIGGAARLIFDIINKLGHKYDMEIVILSDFKLERYPYIKLHHFTQPKQTIGYLKKISPGVIHAYYYGDWSGFHAHFKAILDSDLKSALIENLLVPIHVYRSPRIDEYVYISNYVREIQYQRERNERVIYFGVDLKEFTPKKSPSWNNAVGMVYRLWNDKIDQSTIEMFIALAKERPETLIYIIGDGPNFHHYVERTRQERVRQNFYFTGTIDYSEVPGYYDKFDIFVAPVHTESYGIVVPNAMAKNMTVVAYRRGVLPELLGNTNVLVNTAPEMVEALKYLLDHPNEAKELARGGRERVRRFFSQKIMTERYDELYQELLSRKRFE
jgi:glycosyltransferase involved in cell wall biosynthesis